MKTISFSSRTLKEILRDPLTLFFGLGFPGVLIILLSAIQANIPVSIFEINALAPGMTVFGLSFMTLFSATIVAKDREIAFLYRLYATPMKSFDFILGYTLPLIPISIAQSIFCFAVGAFFGLTITVNIIYSIVFIIPEMTAKASQNIGIAKENNIPHLLYTPESIQMKPEEMMEFFKKSGVRVYANRPCVVYCSQSYLFLHSADEGEYDFSDGKKRTFVDMFTKKQYTFPCVLKSGQSYLFER